MYFLLLLLQLLRVFNFRGEYLSISSLFHFLNVMSRFEVYEFILNSLLHAFTSLFRRLDFEHNVFDRVGSLDLSGKLNVSDEWWHAFNFNNQFILQSHLYIKCT